MQPFSKNCLKNRFFLLTNHPLGIHAEAPRSHSLPQTSLASFPTPLLQTQDTAVTGWAPIVFAWFWFGPLLPETRQERRIFHFTLPRWRFHPKFRPAKKTAKRPGPCGGARVRGDGFRRGPRGVHVRVGLTRCDRPRM